MPTTPWSRPATRRLRPLTGITTVGAVTAGALLGMSGTGAAVLPAEQTVEDVPASVTAGSEVTFTGTLSGTGDRPLAGQQVDLQWRAGPGQPWSVSASDTTDAEGVAAIPATVDRDAQWRLRFAGDQVHDPARSRVQTIDSREPIGQRIVDTAAAQAGKPYSYGADGPGSFDCSGLTQYVHRQVGIELPRTSSDQRAAVPTIAKSDMRPGDLVFFDDGGVYHVGIFAGDDRIWAAPEPGDSVRLQDIWTETYTVGRAW